MGGVGDEHQVVLPGVRAGQPDVAGVHHLLGADQGLALVDGSALRLIHEDLRHCASAVADGAVEADPSPERLHARRQTEGQLVGGVYAEAPAVRSPAAVKVAPGDAAVHSPRPPGASERGLLSGPMRWDPRQRDLVGVEVPSRPDRVGADPQRPEAPGGLNDAAPGDPLPRTAAGRNFAAIRGSGGDQTVARLEADDSRLTGRVEGRQLAAVAPPDIRRRQTDLRDLVKRQPLNVLLRKQAHLAPAPAQCQKRDPAPVAAKERAALQPRRRPDALKHHTPDLIGEHGQVTVFSPVGHQRGCGLHEQHRRLAAPGVRPRGGAADHAAGQAVAVVEFDEAPGRALRRRRCQAEVAKPAEPPQRLQQTRVVKPAGCVPTEPSRDRVALQPRAVLAGHEQAMAHAGLLDVKEKVVTRRDGGGVRLPVGQQDGVGGLEALAGVM